MLCIGDLLQAGLNLAHGIGIGIGIGMVLDLEEQNTTGVAACHEPGES